MTSNGKFMEQGRFFVGRRPICFVKIGKGFGIGCQMDGIEDHCNPVLIGLVSDHLIIADEFVSKESVPIPPTCIICPTND